MRSRVNNVKRRGNRGLRQVVRRLPVLLSACAALASAPPSAVAYSLECHQAGIGCISQYGYAGQSVWGYPVDAAGNNCTNYSAFRLSRNGASNPGNLGNAGDWAANARAKGFAVNSTPAVGAIAQWNYGSAYAPWYGHVAYVEQVTGSELLLSDSNWQGGSKRWRVRAGESQWPSNFIHIRDVAPPPNESTSVRPEPDFTGDGRADLLYADAGTTTIRLLPSTGSSFAGPTAWATGMGAPAWQLAGDVNGDGKKDLIYQDSDSPNIRVLISGGTQHSSSHTFITGMGMSAWRLG